MIYSSEGGYITETLNTLLNKTFDLNNQNFSNGLSIQKMYNNQIYCVDCDNINNKHFLNQTHLIGRVCLMSRWWNISGGYGGGGASCGLNGGGGSGFTGNKI